MKQLLSALVVGCGLLAAQAQAACDYPIAPGKFPDGSVATKEEMLEAKRSVVKYNADIEGYLACINSEYTAKFGADSNVTAKQKAELDRVQKQKEDAAVAEVTAVTERFNEQLRAWKAKTAAEKKPS
jgi:hypothetical protein